MADFLFVGSNDRSAQLRRGIEQQRPEWQLRQINDLRAACEQLKRRPAQVLIACPDDPGIAADSDGDKGYGFAVLGQHCPQAVRVALPGGATEVPEDGRWPRAHQCVASDRGTEHALVMLDAAVEVAEQLGQEPRLQRVLNNLNDIPAPPGLYFDLRERIEAASGDSRALAQVAERDPSLTARILKIVNSGMYAVPRTVSNLSEAIAMLGTETVLGLVLATHLYNGLPPPGLRLDVLWDHAQRVSVHARAIATLERKPEVRDAATVAGLLHDIGVLVLLENDALSYQSLLQTAQGCESTLARLERQTYGMDHGELGAVVLRLWCLPRPIVTAVAQSHSQVLPDDSAARAVLAAEWFAASVAAVPDALAELPPEVIDHWRSCANQDNSQVA